MVTPIQTTATCAACGEKKELCGSARVDGVQQPRICKDCLLSGMSTGDYGINNLLWIKQLVELGDSKSIEAIKNLKSK